MIFWARRDLSHAEAAAWYAAHRRWPVVLGTHLDGGRCSCGAPDCMTPSAHPAEDQWRYAATTDASQVRQRWRFRPDASIVLATGVLFDVFDVPHAPGAEALRRLEDMQYQPGPVAETDDDRVLIWVTASARTPENLPERREWPYDHLGLHRRSAGDFVIAPPSRGVRWVNPPDLGWVLPRADDILGVIARACQEALRGTSRAGERAMFSATQHSLVAAASTAAPAPVDRTAQTP